MADLYPGTVRKSGPLLTVLVVGQVPPPVNGQSLMIEAFLTGRYSGMRLVHVPMMFSRSTAEIGSFELRKVLLLFTTLFHILATRLRSGATILYYPPAGANLVPVLRDIVLLIPTRWLFQKTVFHFHAAGLSKIYPRLPRLLRPLFRLAYNNPDLAIFTTTATSAEAEQLHARRTAIVPCGIPDHSGLVSAHQAAKSGVPSILFAGILCEEKGVLVLLETCRILQEAGERFKLVCLGAFQSIAFQTQVRTFLRETGLHRVVQFPGVVTGAQKHQYFEDADIFCFPSHYPAESFGVVLVEAMSFSLPIVATDWQGIPEVVGQPAGSRTMKLDGALLVPVKSPDALAVALHTLMTSPARRSVMGQHNRRRYLDLFTLDRYRASLESNLKALLPAASNARRPEPIFDDRLLSSNHPSQDSVPETTAQHR